MIATMQNEAGGTCSTAAPTALRLLDDQLALRARVEGANGTCPDFDGSTTSGLAAGTYFLALRTVDSAAPFSYRLRVEVTAGP